MKPGSIRLTTNLASAASESTASAASPSGDGSEAGGGEHGTKTDGGVTSLSASVLKSCLQKNIRRMHPAASVRTASELASHTDKQGFHELIRRLTIIVLEDACLHPALPLLVWLMMANSKGYIPTGELTAPSETMNPNLYKD
jgi:hypothetical protein